MAARALEPDADVVPTGHAAHAFEPAAAANVPTAQSVHALEPAFAAYLPAHCYSYPNVRNRRRIYAHLCATRDALERS